MFANILRTQARLALTSCRARIPVSSISRVAPRFTSLSIVSPASRTISTSRPVYDVHSGNVESQTIYVGNVPFSVTADDIREKFEPFGAIQDIRVAYHPDGRSRGFVHVEFAELQDAIAAYKSLKEEPLYILDRDVRVDYAASRNRTLPPSSTLYFHGFRGTLDELRGACSEVSDNILNILFLRNRETGRETGAGFIYFTNTPSAEEALQLLNGRQTGEDTLRLRFASPKKNRSESQ